MKCEQYLAVNTMVQPLYLSDVAQTRTLATLHATTERHNARGSGASRGSLAPRTLAAPANWLHAMR